VRKALPRFRPELVVLIALGGALVGSVTASAAAPSRTISVFFLRGEQLAGVPRQGSNAADAVRRLIAGPSRADLKTGLRTYVPPGTALHSVSVANGLATVDLGARFTSARDSGSLLARLAQLVRTVSAAGTPQVQLLIDGSKVSGVFPRIPTELPITFALLRTPDVPLPKPRREKQVLPDKRVKQVQQRLIDLGYLPPGGADGRLGPATEEAVLAFQKWERLDRTGVVNGATRSRLDTARRPSPVGRGSVGKRAEVLIDRQVALLIAHNKVFRAISVSTGKPSTPTPPGDYRVYAKIPRWWSVPFREWLPWAVPFVGGIAFHEFGIVPVYPASHGCVRQPTAVARMTYDFAEIGMPVRVVARS
jgi:putative peptidoglycan binding protein/sporulation and spore germination protein/L,D-transpeptidase-like protein